MPRVGNSQGIGGRLRVAVIHVNFGPYHLARARAFASIREIDAFSIELSASTKDGHPWEVTMEKQALGIKTLSSLAYGERGQESLTSALRRELEHLDPDVVVSCGYGLPEMRFAAGWARKNSRGSVLTSESTEIDKPRWWVREYIKALIVGRYFDTALVGGIRSREYLVKLGIDTMRIWEPYDVVDNDFYRVRADSLRLKGREASCVSGLPERYFLYVGRLYPEKNLPFLLDAYRRYRSDVGERIVPWALVIVGDGPEFGKLNQLIKRDNIRGVIFRGFSQAAELPGYYAFAGCFVLPSVSEPWGLVVNEAMAAGLPVLVSSNCGSSADLVRSAENGFVFDPRDPYKLAQLLAYIAASSPEKRVAMGAVSRRIVNEWSPEAYAEGLAAATRAAAGICSSWHLGERLQVFPDDYRVLQFGGKPVIGYPTGSRRLQGAAFLRYLPFTWRKRVFISLARAAAALGVDHWFSTPMAIGMDVGLQTVLTRLLKEIRVGHGIDCAGVALAWPANPERERLYIHFLRADGQPLAFGKLGMTGDQSSLLRHEIKVLRLLSLQQRKSCRIPVMIGEQVLGDNLLVLYEPLPIGCKPVRLTPAIIRGMVQEYGGPVRVVPGSEIRSAKWFGNALVEAAGYAPCFHDALLRYTSQVVAVRRAHGDFGRENLVGMGNQVWLFDWEHSCESAPLFTDEVAYHLSDRFRRIISDPSRGWKGLFHQFKSLSLGDAVLAVSFLYSFRNDAARALVGAWASRARSSHASKI